MDDKTKDMTEAATDSAGKGETLTRLDPFRFYREHAHLGSVFGGGWFGQKAEAFARFFGTPFFLGMQTILVIAWVVLNGTGIISYDVYPFILLNLAFSVQSAYAAPLLLLAQTRQADRDKVLAMADAQHKESLAEASRQREEIAARNSEQILKLLELNTQLTTVTKDLSERIEQLTKELHDSIVKR